MSKRAQSEVVKTHLSPKTIPSIFARQRWELGEYAGTLVFYSFLFTVFFLPLFETWKNVGFGLALFFWIVKMCVSRDFRIKLYPAGWGYLVFLGAACLSALFAVNKFQGLRGVWDIFRYFVVYLLAVNTFESKKQIDTCILVLIISATIGCLWGLGEYYLILKDSRFNLEIHSLGQANHTATYLAIVFSLCVALLVTRLRLSLYPAFLAITTILISWSLFLTRSRTAWVALLVVLAAFIVLMRSWRTSLFFSALILFLGILSFSIRSHHPHHPIREELVTVANVPAWETILEKRITLWKKVLLVIEDHLLLGVGPRNFNYFDHTEYNLGGWNHAHNLYLNTAAELGLLGLTALLGWLGSCWVTLRDARRQCHSNGQYGYWLAAVAALTIIMVSGIVATTLHTEGAMVLSLLIGFSVVASLKGGPSPEATSWF